MQACKRGGKPFVVPYQPTEARGLGEAALHNPTPGQQYEAAFCGWVFHDRKQDAVLLGCLSNGCAGIALIHIG